MKHLGLEPHLVRAIATLNRVDRPLFRGRMTFPTIDGESSIAAITYFYEPFLEAFDPKLREELGVWYTPPEIVRYQVRRVHYLLKNELNRARGLADPDVVVLDPCCGTRRISSRGRALRRRRVDRRGRSERRRTGTDNRLPKPHHWF